MLLRSLLPFARRTRTPIYALRNINLRVDAGETVGMIGRNGAGKTTMLRLMAGVTQPTEGAVRIAGRVAPLISVGVGFHHEMSGRENVYVNGMLLGLSGAEVARRFDEIVAFAELEDFIDTPVKFYSSGMFMRLGFSVAVHSEPNVLLVDEILAVGDMTFQLKCFDKMRELQRVGTSVVMVSHVMSAIRLLCPRVVLIQGGQVAFDGEPEAAIGQYYKVLSETAGSSGGPIAVLSRDLRGAAGADHHTEYDQVVEVTTRVRFDRDVADPHVMFQVLSDGGLLISTTRSVFGRAWRQFRAGDEAEIHVQFRARLGGGSYRLVTTITEADVETQLLRDEGPVIYVTPRVGAVGFSDVLASIEVDGQDRTWRESLTLDGRPATAVPQDDQT